MTKTVYSKKESIPLLIVPLPILKSGKPAKTPWWYSRSLEKMTPLWQEIIQPTIILQGGKDYIIYPENGKYTDSVLVNAPHQYILYSHLQKHQKMLRQLSKRRLHRTLPGVHT